MLDVKQAAKLATENLVDLLGKDVVSSVRLEEVELVKKGDFIDDGTPNEVKDEDADIWDKSYWLITLSYLPNTQNPLIPEKMQRQYKVFKLEADTGDLIAMRMRKVA